MGRRELRGCSGGVEGDLGSVICLWRDQQRSRLWD